MNENEKLAFSVADAAAAAGVSKPTIYAALNCGALKGKRLGGRTLVLASELTRWLSEIETYRPTRVSGVSGRQARRVADDREEQPQA